MIKEITYIEVTWEEWIELVTGAYNIKNYTPVTGETISICVPSTGNISWTKSDLEDWEKVLDGKAMNYDIKLILEHLICDGILPEANYLIRP